MKLIRLLLVLVLLPACCFAKDDYYARFNTDDFWQLLVPDSPGLPVSITPGDTAIVVASSRKTRPGGLRFMSELRGNGAITYFIVYTRKGRWHVQQRLSLANAMAALPQQDRDWVVYAEGMGKIFTTDLDRGISVAGQYSVNVLLLDYPSIRTGYGSYRNYRFAYRNACRAYMDFIPVLDSFKMLRQAGYAGTGKLTLFFHSMGNNVLRKIVQRGLLYKYSGTAWVDNIVLNAPCVPRRKSKRWIDSLHFSQRIYVHYNPHDQTLKWARLAGFRGILGERPGRRISARAKYINFNRLCGDGHSNFLNLYGRSPAKKEAVAHYDELFHGGTINVTDNQLYQKTEDRIGWYIIDATDSGR